MDDPKGGYVATPIVISKYTKDSWLDLWREVYLRLSYIPWRSWKLGWLWEKPMNLTEFLIVPSNCTKMVALECFTEVMFQIFREFYPMPESIWLSMRHWSRNICPGLVLMETMYLQPLHYWLVELSVAAVDKWLPILWLLLELSFNHKEWA